MLLFSSFYNTLPDIKYQLDLTAELNRLFQQNIDHNQVLEYLEMLLFEP